MPTVLVAGPIHDSGLQVLRQAPGIDLDYVDAPDDPAAYLRSLPRADGLLLRTQPLNAASIAGARGLKIVSRHGVGYDAVDVAALSDRGIPLAVVGDVNSQSVAEHTMMLLLATAKHLTRADAAARAGNWVYRNLYEPREIFGKTLLIVGFGRIGRTLAALARPFGLRIHVFDPYVAEPGGAGITMADDLPVALGAADYVSLHVPLSDRPLIGAAEIAAMKPGSVIINTARGGLVDERALAAALRTGHLAGAGLDVFESEPMPAGESLSGLDNVVLTPHQAGLSRECAERMAIVASRNIVEFFTGSLDESLIVNPTALGRAAAAR